MPDKETVAKLKTLREQFAHNAQKDYPQVILPTKGRNGALTAKFFEKTGDKFQNVLGSLERGDLKSALVQLREASGDLHGKSVRQKMNSEECRRFSDDRSLLMSQSEDLDGYYQQLEQMIRQIAREEKDIAEKNAATSPAALLRLAEVLKSDISYHNHYSNISDIQEILVLAAQNQIRQEDTIRQLAERLEKLEKQLAEEPAPMLEKARHTLPARKAAP